MFDSIPYTNKSMHLLRGMLNNPYNASTFQKLVNDDTYLFKLTYKIKLQKEKKDKSKNFEDVFPISTITRCYVNRSDYKLFREGA